MNFRYLIPRVVRHFLPESWGRFILRRNWIIRASIETESPSDAVRYYLDFFEEKGISIKNKRIMVFGYGGRWGIGAEFLRLGASQVILVDKEATVDNTYNRQLLARYKDILYLDDNDRVSFHADKMTVFEADIRDIADDDKLPPVDMVLSMAVYEHLEDVEGITAALAKLTKPNGAQFHVIDLRDHYFKYPFEMLCYSKKVWNSWLNPSSHHNRYRLWDYQAVFEKNYSNVEIEIIRREEEAFENTRHRIRPEFLSGDVRKDNVAMIRVFLTK